MARGKDRPRVLRKDRTGANPFMVGAIVLVVALIGVYFGFSKHVPFTHHFRLKAEVPSANSIRPNSPVRIAGVNVGKVKAVQRDPGSNAALITMQIDDKGLPIHKDATLKIRPRIFLEGNFFVDLKPGTPSAPTLSDDDTLPITQASAPVQFDQVLSTLQVDERRSLRTILTQFGSALTREPSAAEDAAQDPAVRGKTAAQALNLALRTGGDALRDVSIVNDALLGTRPHDLSGLVSGLGRVTRALDRREGTLQDLVTNFNTTMGAFASQSAGLRASIRELGPTLQTTDRTLTDLNAAFPNTRAFAREILPGVRETPATIRAAFPWIAQTDRLLGANELRGLVKELQPTTANLSKVVDQSRVLLPQADLVAQCATKVILPTGDVKIQDGRLTAGVENYKEFWYAMSGLAGESQNFDGNGQYVRFAVGGGSQTLSTGKVGGNLGDILYGSSQAKPIGTRPAYPGHRPPYVSSVPCKDQQVPDLNSASTGPAEGGTRQGSVLVKPDPRTAQPAPAPSASKGSLASELLSRLNPFRGAKGGRP